MASMSIGGLASGLDTATIIRQMMAIERRPQVLLQNKQSLVEARQSLLRDFQSKLRSLQLAAADLRSVALWAQTQGVDSSDPTKVSAAIQTGAAVGGYQLEVTQLASAAQRTFTFTSPAADTTITIDGATFTVRAGMTAQELATTINAARDATVYAAALDDGTIVLSSRETGDHGSFRDATGTLRPDASVIAVVDGSGTLVEQADRARAGRDALYAIDGVAHQSHANVVADAIPGVTLTLRAVTTVSGPVTITVGAPGADTDAITRKLEAFITAYNDVTAAIRSKLTERAVPDPRSQEDLKNGVPDPRTNAQRQAGVLFGDTQLSNLLTRMRQAIYEPLGGMPAGAIASLSEIGISTGGASATVSQDALAGKLTLDTDKLAAALAEDPTGVRNLLRGVDGATGWAQRFEEIVGAAAGTGGILSMRIESGESELKALQRQMAQMDVRLSLRERSLQQMFVALEAALAQSQAQSDWLVGQLAGLAR